MNRRGAEGAEENRLLYDSSVSYKGYLIIPFVFGTVDNYAIYSYKLLAALGHKSIFHKTENPAGMYASSLSNIIVIAQEHLAQHAETTYSLDHFQQRYTYRNNLFIISQEAGKYFYDHYAPISLNNIAAPKLFTSENECLTWIKQGLERANTSQNRQL
jgi:hypothetical protein